METKLTVPISGSNPDEAAGQIKAAVAAGAEALELRVDYLKELSAAMVEKLVAASKPLPVIVTCRARSQGGAIDYPDKLRVEVLAGALDVGAEFIDFEYESFFSAANQEKLMRALSENAGARLILSAHNFEGKFDNIVKLQRHILTLYPAAIPKLVYKANHINDCFEAFDLLHTAGGDLIAFCMGAAGMVSRIIAKKLGSAVSFASIDEESATAPGQLTIEQLKSLYRWDSIDADTEFYGVIADPVAHSLSPAIHNAGFDDIGANKLYVPLLVEGGQDEFEEFMNGVLNRKWLNFRGFSVTIPHKASALEYAKERFGFVEPLAERIGAVNTVVVTADRELRAYNTDYAGALDAITSKLKISRADLKDMAVAVIGAGGVARAIVAGLRDVRAKVKIYNRTVKKAERLAAEFDCEFAGLDDLSNLKAELLINCTSIGMHPDVERTPLPKEYLKKGMAVFDTVYNPAETLLLKQAKKKKAKTIDGVSMFVNQAMAQFKLFTGKDTNTGLMRKTVCKCLSHM